MKGRSNCLKFKAFKDFLNSSSEGGSLFALIVIIFIMTLSSGNFIKIANIVNVLQQISITSLIAIGQALVMITGNIDLSVGSMLSLGGVMAASLIKNGANEGLALCVVLLAGAVVGLINGFITEKGRINSFIVTLGINNVVRGSAFLISNGMPIAFDNKISFLGSGKIGIVYISTLIMLVSIILFDVFMRKTKTGKHLYAVGCNMNAAILSGVKGLKLKIIAFIACGILAAFAGVINAGNLMMADTNSGSSMALDTISACAIGGIAMSGGQGTIICVLIGSAIIGIIKNAFVLLKVSSYWQMIVLGIVIVFAVIIDKLRGSRRK